LFLSKRVSLFDLRTALLKDSELGLFGGVGFIVASIKATAMARMEKGIAP